MAGAVDDQHVLTAVHELRHASDCQRQRMRRSRAVGLLGTLVVGEDDGPPRGVEAAGEHPACFTRFAAEDGIAIERNDNDVRVDHARPLRLQRRECGIDAAVFGELLGCRLGKSEPLGRRRSLSAQRRRRKQSKANEELKSAQQVHRATFIGEPRLRKR